MQHRSTSRPAITSVASFAVAALLAACGGDGRVADGGEDGADTTTDAPADPIGGDVPSFERPEGWSEPDTPPSPMRLHTFEKFVDGERLELIVFAFDSPVGGLDLNLARWAQPRDVATLTDDELREVEVGEFVVTTLYFEADEGDAEPEGAAGPGDAAHGTVGSGRFFAYIERPGTPRVWTVKASGPVDAMRAERAGLEAFVQNL